jgi:hypothetical protein
MNKRIILFFCFCFSVAVQAQSYTWQAKLDSVIADGFYKIQLTPAITSKTQPSFSDLRIYDAQNKEMPYILQVEKPAAYAELFKEYKISNLEKEKKLTRLILENPEKKKIDNIQLVIKNADVTKSLRLSGSDDKMHWYIIKDNYVISDVYSNQTTSTVKIFDFPLSDYKYFKIEISDSASPALNILKAGYFDSYTEDAKYTEVPEPKLSQTDSIAIKETYVKITFDEPYWVDKLYINVEGPHYYYRGCFIGTMHITTLKNGKIEKSFHPLTDGFTLSSNGNNTIHWPIHPQHNLTDKLPDLYLQIINQDNPPLKVTEIKAYQITHNVIAYLQKGKPYKFVFGNDKATEPSYDLANFKDSISSVKTLSIGNIGLIAQSASKEETKTANSFFANKTVMWSALLVVLLILGAMSLKMIKEIGKK